ncbi:MAG: D-arabinono-1,4-lactone oxidase [Pseudomonadales bacterium]
MTSAWTKRRLLKTTGLIASAAGLVPAQLLAAKSTSQWRNWGGNLSSQPQSILVPRSEDQLVELLKSSTGTIRPVGSGHSWSSLVPTQGRLISLDAMNGVVSHDSNSVQADVWGGTKLFALGPALESVDQALLNMSDVNYQSIAGAIATSTHGTGASIGSMSSFVRGLRLVTANGETIDCDAEKNAEIFRAAQVSLGILGVNSRVRLQNQPAHRLHQREWLAETEDVLEDIDSFMHSNQQFELFPLPHTSKSIVVITNPAIDSKSDTIVDRPEAVNDLRQAFELSRTLPIGGEFVYKKLLELAYRSGSDRIGASYKVLAHPRVVPFMEMEYTVPAELGVQCLREVLSVIRKKAPDVAFPLEYRYVKADQSMLSMFSERDGCSISMHQFADSPDWQAYFETLEPVFRKYDGRPHWGKWNSMKEADFAALYPQWNNFKRVRRELDPSGTFLNSYLRSLFS